MQGNTDIQIINHINEHIQKINNIISKFNSFENFINSSVEQDALLFNFLQIGENIKCLSKEFRDLYPEVPFRKIAGVRDIIVHGYSNVNIEKIYKYAKIDIPELSVFVNKILSNILQEDFNL